MQRILTRSLIILTIIGALCSIPASGQGMFDAKPAKSKTHTLAKLPAKIAFIRDKNIWLLPADGSPEKEWVHMENIVGQIGWHPDGKRIVYARMGEYSYTLPDGGGGRHRIYDIFSSNIDSTRANAWWWVTNNHGSSAPEWSNDGKYILYVNDRNANQVDAELPDYQIEYRTFDGTEIHALTRKGAKPRESQGIQPTWSPDRSRVAFVYLKDKTPVGIVIEPASGIVRSEAELEQAAKGISNAYGPQWSPDGQWISYVNSQDDDNGIYLVSPDGKTRKRIFAKTDTVTPHRAPVSWSPDSKWLAFSSADGYVYMIDRDGKNLTKLTSGGNDYFPSFSTK